MSDVHAAAARLESLFEGSPCVDWPNAPPEAIADLVTLARDWFERRDSNEKLIREAVEAMWNLPVNSPAFSGALNTPTNSESQDEMLCGHCHHETPHTVYDAGHERDSSHDWRRCNVCGWKAYGMSGKYQPPTDIEA